MVSTSTAAKRLSLHDWGAAMSDREDREHLRERFREVLRTLQSPPGDHEEALAAYMRLSAVEVQRVVDCIGDSLRIARLATAFAAAVHWRGRLQSGVSRAKGDSDELLRVLRRFGLM